MSSSRQVEIARARIAQRLLDDREDEAYSRKKSVATQATGLLVVLIFVFIFGVLELEVDTVGASASAAEEALDDAYRHPEAIQPDPTVLEQVAHGTAAAASQPGVTQLAQASTIEQVSHASQALTPSLRNASSLSILRKARKEDVRMEPYPHLIIEDALPWDLYERLEAAYPSDVACFKAAKGDKWKKRTMTPNTRYDITAAQVLDEGRAVEKPWFGWEVTQPWREFIEYHSSRAFYLEVLDLFEDAIHAYRPDVEAGIGRPLREMKVSLRNQESKDTDIAIDCQVGVNTPVAKEGPSTVRGPHHDKWKSIFAALLYMPQAGDTCTGGQLQLFRCKNGCKELRTAEEKIKSGLSGKKNHEQFDEATLEEAARVPYKRNQLAMFVNGPASVHGVTKRFGCDLSRHLLNFILLTTKNTHPMDKVDKPSSGNFQMGTEGHGPE